MRIPLFANKEQSKRIIAKYSRINHEDYSEAATSASAKLYDQFLATLAERKSKKQSAASPARVLR